MKELTLNDVVHVHGASLGEIITTVAGATIGAAAAAKFLSGVSVAWLGIVPLSITLAGGFVGGTLGHILYNIEQRTQIQSI